MKTSVMEWQKRWLALALGALGLSAVLAVLLVLTRTPFLQDFLGIKSWFHLVLVLHVNFAVLVWLMSFIAFIWVGQCLRINHAYQRTAWSFGVAGVVLMFISPLFVAFSSTTPIMSNYIPVLDSPVFLAGLGCFVLAITLVGTKLFSVNKLFKPSVMQLSAWFWLGTLVVLLLQWPMLTGLNGLDFFEPWFWGAGHVLQFVYVMALWAVWRWPNHQASSWLNFVALVILVASLVLVFAFDPQTPASRQAFSYLMQWGMPLLILPLIYHWYWQQSAQKNGALRLAVLISVLLMSVGLIMGVLISDDSVMVTAHYHATNAAISIAFMGLAYQMLPGLGLVSVPLSKAQKQIGFYGASMFLYVSGMAASGWLGVPRKTTMFVDEGWEQLAMTVMGIGGFLSILATLVFVSLLLIAFGRSKRSFDHENKI
ncbi:MAG: hypothetical protein RI556_10800 [Hydrogenovibrio sp.]|uniref:hypothetical protein n=1 Tax=Hydrogenovibrio sp. TaxID=2065821 RepID=UPI002870000A|nr:hypothetical protein [Hydrogenovibrio sp.]MDR9499653.1 hypothetical protein [Hydrogenovibrio sp.]